MKIELNIAAWRCIFANNPAKLMFMKPWLTPARSALIGTGLVLWLASGPSLAAQPAAEGGQFKLGPWKAYLVNEITPRLDRLPAPAPAAGSKWMDPQALVPAFARHWVGDEATPRPGVGDRSPRIFRLAGLNELQRPQRAQAMSLLASQRPRVEQSLMMPGLTTQVSTTTAWTVSAVLASQRFVSPGMNLMAYEGTLPASLASGDAGWWNGARVETAHGLGVRVGGEFRPLASVSIAMGYRSRIDMNALANVQGIHGAQAQLDIPSRFEASLSWQMTERVAGVVSSSHIFYNEVGAFPSRAMPARFSGLLGDSTSPEFSWRDLTVFSAGVDIQLSEGLSANIEYANQAQPDPTSKALSDALGTVLNKHAWRVGLRQVFSEHAQLHIGAAYAPPEYAFGGHILGVVSDQLDQRLEGQALWQMWF